MKKALIFENRVIEIAEKEFPVASEFRWVDLKDSTKVEVGFNYDGQNFNNPLSLEEIKKQKYQQIEFLRKYKQFLPISYKNSEFSTSQLARQNMLGIIAWLDKQPFSTKHFWRDIEDKSFNFSLKDFKNIMSAIIKRDTEFYYIEGKIRNNLNSYSKVEDLIEFEPNNLWSEYEK